MRNVLKLLSCFLLNAIVCTSAALAHAEPANDKTLSPYFLIENGDPAVDRFALKDTHVAVNIIGPYGVFSVKSKNLVSLNFIPLFHCKILCISPLIRT